MREFINKIYFIVLCMILITVVSYFVMLKKKDEFEPSSKQENNPDGYVGNVTDYVYANKDTPNMYDNLTDLRQGGYAGNVTDYVYVDKNSPNMYENLIDMRYEPISIEDHGENLYSEHNFLYPKNNYKKKHVDLTKDPINSDNFGDEYEYEIARNNYMSYYSPNNDGDYSIMKRTYDINRNVIDAQKTVMRFNANNLRPYFEQELSVNEKREWWDGSDIY